MIGPDSSPGILSTILKGCFISTAATVVAGARENVRLEQAEDALTLAEGTLCVPCGHISFDEAMALANATALIDQADEPFYLAVGRAEQYSENNIIALAFQRMTVL